jgi:hypothetical protein
MTFPEFIYRFDGFTGTVVNVIICALAAKLYHDTRKRCLFLISIGSGIGAALIVLPEMQGGSSSWSGWYFEMTLRLASSVVWLIGWWLLFRDYTDMIRPSAQQSAPPNGGPATQPDNPEVTEGPPSAS